MYAQVLGSTTFGLNGHVIGVEVDINKNFPSFDIVSTAFGVDKSKKKHGYHGLCTDWSSRIFFFDIILPMSLGFVWDFSGFGALWCSLLPDDISQWFCQ